MQRDKTYSDLISDTFLYFGYFTCFFLVYIHWFILIILPVLIGHCDELLVYTLRLKLLEVMNNFFLLYLYIIQQTGNENTQTHQVQSAVLP